MKAPDRAGQRDRLLAAMRRGEVITTFSALVDYGVLHAASRFSEMKAEGIELVKGWVLVDTKYGGQVRVRSYALAPDDQSAGAA